MSSCKIKSSGQKIISNFREIHAQEKVHVDVQTPYISTLIPFIVMFHNVSIIFVRFSEHVHNHFINRYLTAKKIIPPCGWLLTHLSRLPYCFVCNPRNWGTKFHSLRERRKQLDDETHCTTAEWNGRHTCDIPCNQVLHTTIEKIVF